MKLTDGRSREIARTVARLEFSPAPKPAPRVPKKRKPLRAKSRRKRTPESYAGTAPKVQRVRDEAHLERIRCSECACSEAGDFIHCGGWKGGYINGLRWASVRSEAAHVTNKGWTGGDDQVIPLCPNHHRLLACSWHVAGRVRFQKRFGFNATQLAQWLYTETLRLRGKQTP